MKCANKALSSVQTNFILLTGVWKIYHDVTCMMREPGDSRGGSRIFLGGGALVSCMLYFNTNTRIPVVLQNRRSSRRGGGGVGVRTRCTLPLDPPLDRKLGKRTTWEVYSCFEKGCWKKCTRQSRKVLWVVLSALFSKEI